MMNTYIHMNKSPSSNIPANKHWLNIVSRKKDEDVWILLQFVNIFSLAP